MPQNRVFSKSVGLAKDNLEDLTCACHEDSQRHQRRQRAPQPLLEALEPAPATRTASGASGDNARRSPLESARTATGQPGGSGYPCHQDSERHQRRHAPQPRLEALETAPATRTASGASGDNARRSPFWRLWRVQRAPQPRLEALETAPATRTASGTSGDNARRSPFWRLWRVLRAPRPRRRLWRLRLPRGQPAAPAATTRAAVPSGGSGECNARRSPVWRLWRLRLPRGLPAAPAATTRAAVPSGGSGYCACHEDSKRHQRRQRAPQPLLEALESARAVSGALEPAPATRTASGASGDNARAAEGAGACGECEDSHGQPGGSGYCACHEDSKRRQRRQRAPQPRLEPLETAPAMRTASGTSGDNARRSPFRGVWRVQRAP